MKNFLLSLTFIALLFITNNTTISASSLPGLDDYLVAAEKMPEPIGGIAAVYKNITYPSAAKAAGTEGKVFLMVMVNENGGVDDVKLIKGIGNGCDEAAIEGVKKAKFNPGSSKGANVKVKLAFAVEFKL